MKIQISKEKYEERWEKFEDMEILIKPYPVGRNDVSISSDSSVKISGQQRKDMFMYSVCDWKNLFDAEDKEIKCTKEMKELIFDHSIGDIPNFVYQFNIMFEKKLRSELGN